MVVSVNPDIVQNTTRGSRLRVLAIVVIGWLLLVALVGIGGDFPLNDDYWFYWSARHLAETGRLRILPAVGQLLVWHAAWGAALIRVFGPSHAVVRCGTLAWGLIGLITLSAWARRLRWDVPRTLLLVACVGTSPWYVNLSFSYMTDVPHLVLVLIAALAALNASQGQVWLLVATGVSLGLAALTRQLALLMLPAFAVLLLADARRDHPDTWRGVTLKRMSILILALLTVYLPWHVWFSNGNGTTRAYNDRWVEIRKVSYHPVFHFLATWHYAGLWAFPIAIALWHKSKASLRALLSRPVVTVALVGLLGYAAVAPIAWWVDSPGRHGLNVHYPPLMPYLTNLVYLVGVGVPTIYDTYHGHAPFPHEARWFGVPLTLASVLGGIIVCGVVAVAMRHAIGLLRTGSSENRHELPMVNGQPDSIDQGRARLLIIGISVCYFAGLCLVRFIFDRYIAFLLPFTMLLVIDRCPAAIAKAKLAWLFVSMVAVFSIGASHEYMSWNAARHASVIKLLSAGVPSNQIDGGYEVNGVLRAVPAAVRGEKDMGTNEDPWWGKHARYRLAFTERSSTGCTPIDQLPYWSWPGTGPHAIYTLACNDVSKLELANFASKPSVY